MIFKITTRSQAAMDAMSDAVRAAILATTDAMSANFKASPISTVCTLLGQAAAAAAHLDPVATAAYLRALADQVESGGKGAAYAQATDRLREAFEDLATAAHMQASAGRRS